MKKKTGRKLELKPLNVLASTRKYVKKKISTRKEKFSICICLILIFFYASDFLDNSQKLLFFWHDGIESLIIIFYNNKVFLFFLFKKLLIQQLYDNKKALSFIKQQYFLFYCMTAKVRINQKVFYEKGLKLFWKKYMFYYNLMQFPSAAI